MSVMPSPPVCHIREWLYAFRFKEKFRAAMTKKKKFAFLIPRAMTRFLRRELNSLGGGSAAFRKVKAFQTLLHLNWKKKFRIPESTVQHMLERIESILLDLKKTSPASSQSKLTIIDDLLDRVKAMNVNVRGLYIV